MSLASNFLSPTTARGVSNTSLALGGSSSSSSSRYNTKSKSKAKGFKKASFALDSDTSDDDGMQDEYEDDGFIVFGDEESSEDESEKDSYEDKDFCEVCNDGGNLLVCDGGQHMGGCGSAFHIDCIGKKEIPEGDWVCSSCALKHGIKTGIGGYELGERINSEHNPNLKKDSKYDNPASASSIDSVDDTDTNANNNEDDNEKRGKDKEGQSSESESGSESSDEEDSIAYKDFIRQRQKRMRTSNSNSNPRLVFESDSE